MLVSLFTVVRLTNWRTAVPITMVVLGVTAVAAAAEDGPHEHWQLLVLVSFAVGFGVVSRSRMAYIEAITGRAQQAEETKDAEARRRVAEERLRFARDLHDALAHQVAVINLNASVASQALRSRPDEAEASLATIRHTARTVLAEMGGLFSVLRTDEPPNDSPGSPVPSLHHLHQLIEEFTATGLTVHAQTHGDARELPEPIDIIAYRLIQETLTNALKHGRDQTARLEINYQDKKVQIIATNNTARPVTGPHRTAATA